MLLLSSVAVNMIIKQWYLFHLKIVKVALRMTGMLIFVSATVISVCPAATWEERIAWNVYMVKCKGKNTEAEKMV